jgi:lipoprotein-anchoring transpeptidase ErfK/SrfK
VIGGGLYLGFRIWPEADDAEILAAGNNGRPALTTDRPENGPLDADPFTDVPERGADQPEFVDGRDETVDPEQAAALMASAEQAMSEGDLLLARAHFNEALDFGLTAPDKVEARSHLRRLGRETIFSSRCVKGDPFAEYYVVKPGDNLLKIAKDHDVTPALLARINGIADINRIQAGRRLKVVQGPFHVRITKSTHTLDVYLGDTFVEQFKVGLGAEDSTPSGKWIVKSKLKNPTYYPPRSGDIVAADDPENPLGERWIGLDGIEGNAVGQMRYGIHGTIEPDSIGRDASLGCIRLYNEDVELLYDLLVPRKSTVLVVE